MQIILTRHGETDLNKQGIISGQDQAKLTELGARQAQALATVLCRFSPIHIYSSDLTRAADTARAIQKAAGGELTYLPELRERAYGEIQGKTNGEYDLAHAASGLSADEFKPPGGESRMDLKARVKPVFEKIIAEEYARRPQLTPVIVAHHSVNRRILSICLGDAAGEQPQANCCLNLLEYDPIKGYKALMLNSTEHLVGL